MTDIAEFRGKTPDELKDKVLELKKELFNLRFQSAGGEQSATGRFRAVRRDIARIKTVINESHRADLPAGKAAKPAVAKARKRAEAKESGPAKDTQVKKTTAKKKASGE